MSKNTKTQDKQQTKNLKKKALKIATIGGIGLAAVATGVYLKKKIGADSTDLIPKTPMHDMFDPDNDPAFSAARVTDNLGRIFEGHWFDPGETSNEYIFFTTKEYSE